MVESVKLGWRAIIGLTLLLVLVSFSIWQSVHYFDLAGFSRRYAKYHSIESDGLSRFERKLSCLKETLHPGEHIGFLSSLEGNDRLMEFYWTQYTLAPTIVADDASLTKLVAVFPDHDTLAQFATSTYIILIDCGNGAALLVKAGQQ
jgi:hypothetical protein